MIKLLKDNKKEGTMQVEEDKYYEDSKDSNMTVSAQEANLVPYYTKFDDKAQKQLLEDACAYVDNEIEMLKKRIAEFDGTGSLVRQQSKQG